MTELTSPLKRQLKIYGIVAPVNVEITTAGLLFSIVGTRKKVSVGWVQIIQAASTEKDVLSYLEGRPFEFLQHQAKKRIDFLEK